MRLTYWRKFFVIFKKLRIYRSSQPLGFTLIELLVVIGVIGILVGGLLIIVNPQEQIGKAQDGRRKGDLQKIQTALELYRADMGSYPLSAALQTCDVALTDGGAPARTYLQRLPCDPKRSGGWYNSGNYYYSSNGVVYSLIACLANRRDISPGYVVGQPPGNGCASGVHYLVSNP